MTLLDQIIEAYPEIDPSQPLYKVGIELRNDSDGLGDYIKEWNYSKPIPNGLTLGKPGGN